MRSRGRQSAAAIEAQLISGVGAVTPPRARLAAPPELTPAERKLFTQIVDAADARHFTATDEPLLTSYVQATLLARKTAGKPKLEKAWHGAVRLQAALSTKLRLNPQTRVHAKTQGTRTPEIITERPWARDEEETEED